MGGRKATVLQAFEPEPGAIIEIEVAEGDVVELLDREAPDGWAMVEVDGIEGMVPAAYLNLEKEQTPSVGEAGGNETAIGLPAPSDLVLDDDDEDGDDANRRMALFDFEAEPGSIYELALVKGEIVELTDDDAPDGWVAALSLSSDKIGLVPEVYLGAAPRLRPDAPTQEELELKKAKEQKAEVERELAAMKAAKKVVEDEKEVALEEAAEREEKLKKDMEEVEARETTRLEQEAIRKAAFDEEEQLQAARRREMEEAEKLWPSTDQRVLRAALDQAERARLEAEHAYLTVRLSAEQAEQRLKDAQRLADEAADKLRENERARDANARAHSLMPGLRELLAPTQEELKMCVETVTNAVMKNAEESARLLAKLSITQDPKEALQEAVAKRAEGLDKLGFARSQHTSRMASASLPGTGGALTELSVERQRSMDSSGAATPVVPQPPPGGKPTASNQRTFRPMQSRSAPSSIAQTPVLRPAMNGPTRASMPDRLKETVGGNRTLTLQHASSVSTSPRHVVGVRPHSGGSRRSAMAPMAARSSRASPRRATFSPAAAPPPAPTAAPTNVGYSGILPPESVDSSEPEPVSSAAPDNPSTAVNTAEAAADPTVEAQLAGENTRQPVWKGMSEVAPRAGKPARMMEKQQKKMRKELAEVRKGIIKGNYGHIDVRIPSATERVQQRTSHATYTYMMRQRKARQEFEARRAAWETNFNR